MLITTISQERDDVMMILLLKGPSKAKSQWDPKNNESKQSS